MTTEERLDHLERELARARRQTRWVLGGASLMGGILAMACAYSWIPNVAMAQATKQAATVLRANQLILEDENGKTRLELVVDKGGPAIRLLDENGKRSFVLFVGNEGPGLAMGDDKVTRVGMTANKNGPLLTMRDEDGKARASLGAVKEGPYLTMCDENGKSRAELAACRDGPRLELRDENEKSRAVLGIARTKSPDGKEIKYPESSLLLFGPDEKAIWSAPR